MSLFVFFAVLLGLCFGSFANVVVHRLPLGQSVVTPRSRCPHCGHALAWWENLPLLSYVILRGRCLECKASISLRYPLLELTYALWSLLIALKFGPSVDLGGFAVYFVLGGILITASAIDLDHYILPDVFTLPGAVLAFLGAVFFLDMHWLDSLAGALAGFLSFLLIQQGYRLLRGEEGLGGGDVKLMLLLGAWLGWRALPMVIMASSILGLIVGLIAMKAQPGKGLKTRLPFGPFLSLGGMLYALWGDVFLWLSV